MKTDLKGKRVAILATDGFEQSELESPRDALKKAGAETTVVSIKSGTIKGKHHDDPGEEIKVDSTLDQVDAADYDALLLPGGLKNPDTLRTEPKAVEFVRAFYQDGKPIAAICHGPWLLVEAGVVRGHKVTSYPSVRTDLTNAGAQWQDQPVVTDQGIVTSRTPDDLPHFNAKMLEEFAEGEHPRNASRQHDLQPAR